MMLPDGELAAMWKAARGLRRTATQYDALASEWPNEASHYQSEAERVRALAEWHLATLRRATRGNGRATLAR